MKTFALATGSSGNCIYLESSSGKKILVDAGLSFKKINEILENRNIDIKSIDYVFITHEHIDHCVGLKKLCEEINVPVFISKGTYEGLDYELKNIEFIKEHDTFEIDDLKIFVLSKSHDSNEALSFVFENGLKVGIFTDLGFINNEIKYILKTLDIVYFEASYCHEIISKRKLSYHYVNRLVSDVGHLCVDESAQILGEVCNSNQKIVLSHISQNANTYENAYLKIKNYLNQLNLFPQIIVSFQTEPSEWLE